MWLPKLLVVTPIAVSLWGAGATAGARSWRDCPDVPNLAGGPYDVQVQRVSCRTAERLSTAECKARNECPHYLGFRCRTRITGRESSLTTCLKVGQRRVRWVNGP